MAGLLNYAPLIRGVRTDLERMLPTSIFPQQENIYTINPKLAFAIKLKNGTHLGWHRKIVIIKLLASVKKPLKE